MKLRTKFGRFGGLFIPEMMVPAMEELEEAFKKYTRNKKFQNELRELSTKYAGRPTPLYFAKNMSKDLGTNIYLKREDLLHTGAHKINNTLGQALLAKYMGKQEIIAETGAGQHGVATAAAGALLNIPVKVFMGTKDIERQSLNVYRMELFGAEVVPVKSGSRSLKDAVNEALRYFISEVKTSYYLLGSVVGPHPYPTLVQFFQNVIGKETKQQIMKVTGKLPTAVVACVGGGSNAIGIFSAFLKNDVRLIGVEAGGDGKKHGKTLSKGTVGIFQGSKSFVLQDKNGQINEAHSISAGLDYPGVGPVHSYLRESNKVMYGSATDSEALRGLKYLCKTEGILPALESAHAIAYVTKHRSRFKKNDIVIINLSGRGDKDVNHILEVDKK